MTKMVLLNKVFFFLAVFHSSGPYDSGDVNELCNASLEFLNAEIKLAKATITVSDDLKFRFSPVENMKYDHQTEYSVKEAEEILKEFQELEIVQVILPMTEDYMGEQEKALIHFFEIHKFDKIIFTRASGHGTPHLAKYYKRSKSKDQEKVPPEARPAAKAAETVKTTGPADRNNSPFENSLGMKFVPVGIKTGGRLVLFCIWETRRRDYEAYAGADSRVDSLWRNEAYQYLPVGHEDGDPVVEVNSDDAVNFCAWLTKKERESGKIGARDEYRLPTDAEWSYAVGIGEMEDDSKTPEAKSEEIKNVWPWGKRWPPPERAGNYSDSVAQEKFGPSRIVIEGYADGYATTSPVGRFDANEKGLYDLGGNVWEWCGSSYESKAGGAETQQVLRGGSWGSHSRDALLSSFRLNVDPNLRHCYVGFRCVLVVFQ